MNRQEAYSVLCARLSGLEALGYEALVEEVDPNQVEHLRAESGILYQLNFRFEDDHLIGQIHDGNSSYFELLEEKVRLPSSSK